jgi:hypothetical protein
MGILDPWHHARRGGLVLDDVGCDVHKVLGEIQMKTSDSAKRAFLRAEGWKPLGGHSHYWDPKPTEYWPIPFPQAFEIATRRRAARERKLLLANLDRGGA